MLSIDTSNLFPLFFGLRGHVWEKPHTIAQRPEQTCINQNITQILSHECTSPHNNELAANGSRTKINIGAARACHRQNMFVIKCIVKLYNCTTRLLFFCSQAAIPKSAFTSSFAYLRFYLLTYLLSYVLTYVFTYLLIHMYSFLYLLVSFISHLLTYYLLIYSLFLLFL